MLPWLQNLAGEAPTFTLGDGTQLVGAYEEHLGSLLFFQRTADDTGRNEVPPEEGDVAYVCHTESKITCRAPNLQARWTDGAGAAAGGAGPSAAVDEAAL